MTQRRAVALVTGASSGIGREIGFELARRGWSLILVARREARLREVAARAVADGARSADWISCDLRDRGAIASILERIEGGGLRVDTLVNCAGFGTAGDFSGLDWKREADEIRVNCEALVSLTGVFLPPMVASGSGAILNVASAAGFQPLAQEAVYAASKAFVISFTEALHVELRGTGVTATLLCPGPVRTEFQEVAGDTGEHIPAMKWMDAATVARLGVDGALRGERLVVPGLANRAGAVCGRYVPRPLLLRIAIARRRHRIDAESTSRS